MAVTVIPEIFYRGSSLIPAYAGMTLCGSGFLPGPLGGSLHVTGGQVRSRDAHTFNGAVLDDLDGLQVGQKTPEGDAGGLKTDTTRLFGNTASRDALAHAGLFTSEITYSRHLISFNSSS